MPPPKAPSDFDPEARRRPGLDADAVRVARDFMLTARRDRRSESPREAVAKQIALLREVRERGGGPPRTAPESPREPASPLDPASPSPAAQLAAETEASPPTDAVPSIVLAAPGVRRSTSGWRASCVHRRGVDARFVADARYGGYVGAFLQALEVRDGFYRDRGLPIPWEASATVHGQTLATELVNRGDVVVVRWRGVEHVVDGADALEVATDLALDLLVEWVGSLPER